MGFPLFFFFNFFFFFYSMPRLFSLAKVAIVASCVFGLTYAEPAMFEQEAIVDFGKDAWNDVQHVFQSTNSKIHTATDKVKEILQQGADAFTAFTHPAFPEYALRYKKPTLCDPNVKQVKYLMQKIIIYIHTLKKS
jgi:cathepsin A (carboxypeptidase C)